jgi:tetratricopeptide (TPR) repeat protein
MKKHLAMFIFVLLMLGLCVPPGFAQSSGTVKGVVKDADGNPIVGAVVVWANENNGQKYTITTKKNGEYFSLGITPGTYTVTLYKNADDAKANKPMDKVTKVQVTIDEIPLDFDEKKVVEERAKAQAKAQGVTPEQAKKEEESVENIKKANLTIKALNERIVAAGTSMKAGDFDTAIATLNEATQMDASRDVLWALLGDAYRGSALKQTDPAEKSKRLQEAITDYQKAIDLKQKALAIKTDPDEVKRLAGYYNNLGEALGRTGKTDDAVNAYTQAAQQNPEGAAGYYYNAGAVLTNAGKVDAAIAAFDKCIAADPTKPDAYYQKGVNLIGKATLQGDKMVAPPGTAEAFNKYLELAPTGIYADVSKQMLASIGAPIETGFGNKKKAAAPTKK